MYTFIAGCKNYYSIIVVNFTMQVFELGKVIIRSRG